MRLDRARKVLELAQDLHGKSMVLDP